jgi:hypothetical protein
MHAVRTAPPASAEAASPARGVKRSAADDADGEQQRLSKRFGTMTLSRWPLPPLSSARSAIASECKKG